MFYFQFTGIQKVMTVTENKIGFIITVLVLANIYFIFYTFLFKVKLLHPKVRKCSHVSHKMTSDVHFRQEIHESRMICITNVFKLSSKMLIKYHLSIRTTIKLISHLSVL